MTTCVTQRKDQSPSGGVDTPSSTGKISSLQRSRAFSTCSFQLDPTAWEALQGLPSPDLGRSQHSLVRAPSSWLRARRHHLPADMLQRATAWPLHCPCTMEASWELLVLVQCPPVGNPCARENPPNLQPPASSAPFVSPRQQREQGMSLNASGRQLQPARHPLHTMAATALCQFGHLIVFRRESLWATLMQ